MIGPILRIPKSPGILESSIPNPFPFIFLRSISISQLYILLNFKTHPSHSPLLLLSASFEKKPLTSHPFPPPPKIYSRFDESNLIWYLEQLDRNGISELFPRVSFCLFRSNFLHSFYVICFIYLCIYISLPVPD